MNHKTTIAIAVGLALSANAWAGDRLNLTAQESCYPFKAWMQDRLPHERHDCTHGYSIGWEHDLYRNGRFSLASNLSYYQFGDVNGVGGFTDDIAYRNGSTTAQYNSYFEGGTKALTFTVQPEIRIAGKLSLFAGAGLMRERTHWTNQDIGGPGQFYSFPEEQTDTRLFWNVGLRYGKLVLTYTNPHVNTPNSGFGEVRSYGLGLSESF